MDAWWINGDEEMDGDDWRGAELAGDAAELAGGGAELAGGGAELAGGGAGIAGGGAELAGGGAGATGRGASLANSDPGMVGRTARIAGEGAPPASDVGLANSDAGMAGGTAGAWPTEDGALMTAECEGGAGGGASWLASTFRGPGSSVLRGSLAGKWDRSSIAPTISWRTYGSREGRLGRVLVRGSAGAWVLGVARGCAGARGPSAWRDGCSIVARGSLAGGSRPSSVSSPSSSSSSEGSVTMRVSVTARSGTGGKRGGFGGFTGLPSARGPGASSSGWRSRCW
jgi:hypothetical protein